MHSRSSCQMYVITLLDTCFVYAISALLTDGDYVAISYLTLAQRACCVWAGFTHVQVTTFCLQNVGPTPAPFWDLEKKIVQTPGHCFLAIKSECHCKPTFCNHRVSPLVWLIASHRVHTLVFHMHCIIMTDAQTAKPCLNYFIRWL